MKKTCHKCGTEKLSERLPRGWKNHRDAIWCEKCWRDGFVLRTIAFPVVKPLGNTWEELREKLSDAWAYSTQCANWMTDEMYARDVRRKPVDGKCPPMPQVYLYPEAVKLFPELPSASVAGMEQAVKRKYGATRYETIWTHGRALSTHRYPYPFSMPNQAWNAKMVTAGKDGGDLLPACEITLLRGSRFALQLKGGNEFHRQLSAFRQIISDEAVKGECAVYRVRVNGGNGVTDRDSGGQRAQFRVMVKMVAWLPRVQRSSKGDGVLVVKSDVDAMLKALDQKGNKIWWLNADHVKRWTVEHRRQLQRWSEDQKHENRPIASFQSRRELAAEKFKNRIRSFIKESTSQLGLFAVRRRYKSIELDLSDHRYLPEFQWYALEEWMGIKLDGLGIALEKRASAPVPEEAVTLAKEEPEDA